MREAQEVFDQLGLTNITAMTADGSHGLPDQAPFDRILVTAAAEDPPGTLLAQLRDWRYHGGAGRPVRCGAKPDPGDADRRNGYDYDELRPVRFVPLVEGLGQD